MTTGYRKLIPREARWHDILNVESRSSSISFKNNRLHGITEKENSGMGIRINIDGRTGFSFTNDEARLAGVTEKAVELARFGDREGYNLPEKTETPFEPYDTKIENINTADEIKKGKETIEKLRGVYPDIHADLSINVSAGKMRLENSRGLDAAYRNSYYAVSVSATYIPEEGSKIDVWESISSRSSLPFLHLGDKLLDKIKKAEKIISSKSGRIPVIMSPRAFSRLLGIIASGLDARSVFKGISPFEGRRGEKLFSEKLTIVDDPLVDGSPYSFPFDDEGITARTKNLIAEGTVENFITDLKHAERLNIEAMGNASRSYSSLPSPAFSSVIVAPGDTPLADLLKTMPQAILVESFIGLGQSNTLTGEFSANLDLAYMVKKGETVGRVKDCMVKGNLFELLKGDIIISEERELLGSSLVPHLLIPAVDYTTQG